MLAPKATVRAGAVTMHLGLVLLEPKQCAHNHVAAKQQGDAEADIFQERFAVHWLF